MATHIVSARADGTVEKYSYQVKLFKRFCEDKGFLSSPAHPVHVGMYLSILIDEGKSSNVVSSAFYAIKWLHNINDLVDPTESSIVKNILESAKRLNSRPVLKKDVISREMLIKLCDMYSDSTDIIVLRDLCMILLCYTALLRYSDVSELRCCDIHFMSDHIVVHVRKSKTDVYRAGRDIFVAKGCTSACAIDMLNRYIGAAGIDCSSEDFLFKPACRSKSNCFLISKNKKLSYSRARECIVGKLKLVAPELRLGTHSLRASGATAAANAEGVSERCLKRHGRWKSDSAKDGYVDDSVERKLFITKQMNL